MKSAFSIISVGPWKAEEYFEKEEDNNENKIPKEKKKNEKPLLLGKNYYLTLLSINYTKRI